MEKYIYLDATRIIARIDSRILAEFLALIFQSCDRLKSDTSAAQEKKKKNLKKNAFRSGLPICHELWDIAFIVLA